MANKINLSKDFYRVWLSQYIWTLHALKNVDSEQLLNQLSPYLHFVTIAMIALRRSQEITSKGTSK